jgi:hypothetical protein
MTNDIPLLFQKTMLEIEYRTLSRVRDEFPRKSNHRAVEYIEKELCRILDELKIINDKLLKLRI